MPASKTKKTLLASQALAANASVNATEWDLRAAYGGLATVKITNGPSAPTTPPVVKFFVGEDSGVKRLIWQGSGDTVANSIVDIPPFDAPSGTMFLNITITGGATNGSTVEAYGQELTGL